MKADRINRLDNWSWRLTVLTGGTADHGSWLLTGGIIGHEGWLFWQAGQLIIKADCWQVGQLIMKADCWQVGQLIMKAVCVNRWDSWSWRLQVTAIWRERRWSWVERAPPSSLTTLTVSSVIFCLFFDTLQSNYFGFFLVDQIEKKFLLLVLSWQRVILSNRLHHKSVCDQHDQFLFMCPLQYRLMVLSAACQILCSIWWHMAVLSRGQTTGLSLEAKLQESG